MKDFIKLKLREDLEYHFASDASPESDEYGISEDDLNVPSLSLAKKVEVSDEEQMKIKSLTWKDLSLEPQNESTPVNIRVGFPWESQASQGVAVDIALVGGGLYQVHISLAESLRGLGLGYKIYKGLIMNFGHLYSGKGRRMNNVEVPKIWATLNQDPDMSCHSTDVGEVCIANITKNKDEILKLAGIA